LARTYKGRLIPATEADFTTAFEFEGRTITVKGWYDLILPGLIPQVVLLMCYLPDFLSGLLAMPTSRKVKLDVNL
jgi:hypothetical protein